ncbi:SAM-dependent methyltransferase [Actinosynnema sp. NPDC059797]
MDSAGVSGPLGRAVWSRADSAVVGSVSAHPARAVNYLLGGGYHVQADRDLARWWSLDNPGVRRTALEDRYFLGRAVEYARRAGLRVFVDVGTGVPALGAPHEVLDRGSRPAVVVYVQSDPMLLELSRLLLSQACRTGTWDGRAGEGRGRREVVGADALVPWAAWTAVLAGRLLVPAEPVCLLTVGLLDHVDEDTEMVTLLRDWRAVTPRGSLLVLSAPLRAATTASPDAERGLAGMVRAAGWDLDGPVVRASHWRAADAVDTRPDGTGLGDGGGADDASTPVALAVNRDPAHPLLAVPFRTGRQAA